MGSKYTPQRKVAVGAAVSGIVVVLAWASKAFANVDVPAEVGIAINGILTFAAQYFLPDAVVDEVTVDQPEEEKPQ